jgi:hypothetical protein
VVGAGDRRIEGEHVHGSARQIQGESAGGRGAHPPRLRRQGLAQVFQAGPQIGERLPLPTLGPEDAGQPLPLDLPAGAQGEEGEQPFAFTGPERRDRPAVDLPCERAKELELQRSRIGGQCRQESLLGERLQ